MWPTIIELFLLEAKRRKVGGIYANESTWMSNRKEGTYAGRYEGTRWTVRLNKHLRVRSAENRVSARKHAPQWQNNKYDGSISTHDIQLPGKPRSRQTAVKASIVFHRRPSSWRSDEQ